VHKSRQPAQNQRALDQFLIPLTIVDFDYQATLAYGRIRAALEAQGNPIGPLDTLIAAHALSLNATLITNNTREFARVPDLRMTNWVTD
jgi:tRNA(fMet)-specific endonuclease VapC